MPVLRVVVEGERMGRVGSGDNGRFSFRYSGEI